MNYSWWETKFTDYAALPKTHSSQSLSVSNEAPVHNSFPVAAIVLYASALPEYILRLSHRRHTRGSQTIQKSDRTGCPICKT
jgi:hypothetical protein